MPTAIKTPVPKRQVPVPRKRVKPLITLDTECTGLDLIHGCRPFLVSTCDEEENFNVWEWHVNPFTRTPIIPNRDKVSIRNYLQGKRVVMHYSKFDKRALESIDVILDWRDIDDTLPQHHVLASNQSHGLKDLGVSELDLGTDDEEQLQQDVNECRRIGKSLGWRIAAPFDPHFPAMKRAPHGVGWWVMDMWLPREVARHQKLPLVLYKDGSINEEKSHRYWWVCRKYNMLDDIRCLGCHMIFTEALKQENREHLYHIRQKLQPITYQMESNGVTVSLDRLQKAKPIYQGQGDKEFGQCKKLSFGLLDNIDSDAQIREVLYGKYKLTPPQWTKPSKAHPEGLPKVDQKAVEVLMDSLDFNSPAFRFLDHLGRAKKNYKAFSDLEDYERRGIPVSFPIIPPNGRASGRSGRQQEIFLLLHGNFNTTGTDTTRFSSSGPNLQNISKKEDIKTGEDYNIRRVFGPAPGREWYSIDYSNIELRIFAYKSGDEELIKAFETGYSVHLIVAKALHPDTWTEIARKIKSMDDKAIGKVFKKVYESTLYQWIKNGNFALIYGAGVKKADRTFHVPGAYHTIRRRFPLIDSFMRDKNREAEEWGGVTCLGGSDDLCGYFLEVPHDRPHVAVNYFVQGSAGWCMTMAMIRVQAYLDGLNAELGLSGRDGYYMNLTVHDELDFDFPIHARNTFVIRHIAKLMEQSGDDIGVPCPVEIERHSSNWAEGELVAAA